MTGLLFGGPDDAERVGTPRSPGRARVLITVKASPNPSATHGETVCVAGIRLDLERPGWIRLYPINFRDLAHDQAFSKYNIVVVDVAAQPQDSRAESWRPNRDTLRIETAVAGWPARRKLVEPYATDTTCAIYRRVDADQNRNSLGLVRPVDFNGLAIERHPGWTADEQAKIDQYANQMSLFGNERAPLQAPRFRGVYSYRCADSKCGGHSQSMLDWEFTAFQYRHLRGQSDSEAIARLRARFFDEICAPTRDVAFYLGNQAKRRKTFSILGVWYPPK